MKGENFPDLLGFGGSKLDQRFKPDVMLDALNRADVYFGPYLQDRQGLHARLKTEADTYHFKRVQGTNSTQQDERHFLAAAAQPGGWHEVFAASVYDWLSSGLRDLGREEWPVPWDSKEVQVSRPDPLVNGEVVLDRRRHKNFAVVIVTRGSARLIVNYDTGKNCDIDLPEGYVFLTGFGGCHTNKVITRVDVMRPKKDQDYELFTIRQRIPRSVADN